jgi:hypothetical protein
MMTQRPDPQAVATGLFDAWNNPARDARHSALSQVVSDRLVYLDPHQEDRSLGQAAYLALSDQFHEVMAGYTLELGPVDGHHNIIRFGSVLRDTNGAVFSKGQFFAVLDDQGRISLMAAFGA